MSQQFVGISVTFSSYKNVGCNIRRFNDFYFDIFALRIYRKHIFQLYLRISIYLLKAQPFFHFHIIFLIMLSTFGYHPS